MRRSLGKQFQLYPLSRIYSSKLGQVMAIKWRLGWILRPNPLACSALSSALPSLMLTSKYLSAYGIKSRLFHISHFAGRCHPSLSRIARNILPPPHILPSKYPMYNNIPTIPLGDQLLSDRRKTSLILSPPLHRQTRLILIWTSKHKEVGVPAKRATEGTDGRIKECCLPYLVFGSDCPAISQKKNNPSLHSTKWVETWFHGERPAGHRLRLLLL